MKTITLTRFAYSPDGTFGRLELPGGWSCFTVEKPWLSNSPYESCIPDGVYDLKRRRSPVVERTSGGDYVEGWEVFDVPGRTYIMIHPGNWPRNFEGCIGVGTKYMVIRDPADGQWKNGVSSSRNAFAQLMGRLDGGEWQIDIRPFVMEWS